MTDPPVPGRTLIGNLGSPEPVLVGERGRVVLPGGWSLDWLAGAADRWHEPAASTGTAVTQHRPAGLPVVETSLRVPGGQLVHRAWCTTDGGVDVALVEVENRSRDAVAVALVVDGHGARVGVGGDRAVAVGGAERLRLGRPAARVAAGSSEDVRDVVRRGDAALPDAVAGEHPCAGLVFPLAHTARLRVALGVDGLPPERIDGLPAPEQVAAGWQAHLDVGARLAVPDQHLADAVAAARCSLLIGHRRAPEVAVAAAAGRALAEWGHGDAAAATVSSLHVAQRVNGGFGRRGEHDPTAAVLAAWAALARVVPAALAEELAGPAAKAAHRLGRRHRRDVPGWFAAAQLDAAELLARAGQPDAAELCRARAGASGTVPAVAPAIEAAALAAVAGEDLAAAAGFLQRVRQGLLDDRSAPGLRLFGGVPDAWLGQDLELHRLPTRAGRVSVALRWHGTRPALLWEVDRSPGDQPLALVAPRFDPGWSTSDQAGEALLAPVEPAGGLPAVVAPLAGPATQAADAPRHGESFA